MKELTGEYHEDMNKMIRDNEELNAKVALLAEKLAYISNFMLENADTELFNELYSWGRGVDDILNATPADCLKSIQIKVAIELAGIFHDGKWRSDVAMEICEDYAKKLRNGI